eukprot:TRINITY_DN9179_c0_g1_i1.p1 TRINITY_DN9179_c0_g1~~TRINITY_DN9179_c0_g1_i1.p1  ORF type:complete len:106 (-),score=19.96 TRINITY_DN9179_c0_g1_i1:111-428(-)
MDVVSEQIHNYYKDDIELLHSIINTLDMKNLGGILYEGMIPTQEYEENFSRLNEFVIQYNDRLDKIDKEKDRLHKNQRIISNRSKENREALKLNHSQRLRKFGDD